MSTIPPLESSSDAAISIDDENDDDFGSFSAFETAESSDMKSNDEGSPDKDFEENAPAASPPPPLAMMSSSLNEDEFFDVPFEAASMNQINDLSNENVEEEEAAAEEIYQPEEDLFSSVADAAIIPPEAFPAVESDGGAINDNIVADNTDPFSAFDEIVEGGGDQNEASHFNQQDNVGLFGEFEGTGSDSSNNIANTSPSNGDNDNSPTDTSEPVSELAKDAITSPDFGENPPPETYFKETHNTVSLEGDASGFDSHASSEVNGIAVLEQTYQGASETTTTPVDTLSAFDAFAEIQDAPLPSFGSASGAIEVDGDAFAFGESELADAATGTTMIDASDDDFGGFADVRPTENAADESNNEDEVAVSYSLNNDTNNTTEEGEDAEETEATPGDEVTAQVPKISADEAAPTNEAAADDNVDVFGAFEETVPIQTLQESTSATAMPMEDATESTIPCEERKYETPMEDTPDAQEDTGFTCFEATIPVNGTHTNEVEKEKPLVEEDFSPVESAVEESDAFGAFSAQTQDDSDTAHAEQGIPVEEDTALTTDATGEHTAFDVAAVEEEDDFGDFSAPNEEDLPDEVDTALTEVDAAREETAVEESDDFGDFTAPEDNMDTGNSHAEQDIPVEEDTALTTEAFEKGTAFDEAAVEEADDNFGEFSAPVEEELPDELDTALTEVDTAPVETAVTESDAFGAFSALSQDFPVKEDTALTTEATGEDTAFDETAVEEEDDFGDFSAPNEEDLPDEVDTALTEEGISPVETVVEESDAFGDFTAPEDNVEVDTALAEGAIQESDFDDFGGFAAPPVVEDEALVEGDLPVEEDVGLVEQDTNLAEGGFEENDDFGDFSAHVGEDPLAEADATLTEKYDAPPETTVEEDDDFGDFSAPVEVETALDTASVAPDEVESNNFGDFTAPVEEFTSPVEAAVNESDEFGDFGGFSSPVIEAGAATTASEGADEDFGNFGDFTAPVEADTENNNEEEGPGESHKPVDTKPAVEDDDGFGEFGDFAAFEEAAPADTPADNHQTAQVEEKATEDDIPTPQMQSSSQAVSAEEDEFGDFGDFDDADEVKEISDENVPSRPVHVLNENVRDMFQKVFQVAEPADPEKGDGCVQLPFDVPMRTSFHSYPSLITHASPFPFLSPKAPRKSTTEEKGDNQTYKSETEINDITAYIESLPTYPPSTILSEEKWYPYSQYVFHHDGTPYTDKANLMGVSAPSVPEVLSIELPTGFDASTFRPTTSSSSKARCTTPPPTRQSVQATATMVDFPSADAKMTEEDVKEAAEDDEFGKLSAAGKKFMEQLPDLSYMLQPTLSTVK
eukprot:scaffold6955_cov70-Skeletonema_dohrnii-CCMP3373.AAC.1